MEEAWKKIEKIPGAKAFMGGSTGAHTGFFNFHVARRSVDDREAPSPLYPAAAIMFDVGIIVGAHKTATIANAIQGKLSKALESAMASGIRPSPLTALTHSPHLLPVGRVP